jgi:FkbM family methyltransferase
MAQCTPECTSPINWDNLIYTKISDILYETKQPLNILDIGSNIGSFIVNIGILPNIKNIYGIEPDTNNFNLLQQNTQQSNISNLKLLNYAVSNIIGDVDLYEGNGTCETFNILNSNNSEQKRSKVKCITLDFLQNKLQTNFDIIKIDVEGAECNVLEKGINTIKNSKYVFLEIHNKTTFTEILNFVKQQNWKIKCLKNNHLIDPDNYKIDFCYQVVLQP